MSIKSNPEWDEKSPLDKRLNIIGIVLALVVLLLAALQMAGVASNLTIVFVPLMGLLMLVKAMQMWNSTRAVAIICVVIAVVLFVCSFILALAMTASK